jgi:hypothetical protein
LFCFVLFAALGFELRALCLLGSDSAVLSHIPSPVV